MNTTDFFNKLELISKTGIEKEKALVLKAAAKIVLDMAHKQSTEWNKRPYRDTSIWLENLSFKTFNN